MKYLLVVFPVLLLSLPAHAAYPEGCAELQACVDDGVSSTLASCQTSNPTCDLNQFATNRTSDRFGVSSGAVADRAIELRNCASRTTKRACNACYQAAKAPLKNRFFGRLFRGMLANAIQLIEAERKATCPSLP